MTSPLHRAIASVSFVVLSYCSTDAASLQLDDFQTGPDDWTSGGSAVTHETTGGPAGAGDAFLSVASTFRNLAVHNSTDDWTGDFASIGATSVTADLMAPSGSADLSIRLVLFGPGANPNSSPRWTSAEAALVPGDGAWRNYEFSLAEDDLSLVLRDAAYADLMADVLRVMFRHDPDGPSSGGASINGTLNIDNVALVGAATTPGDFDADGDADGRDFLLWQRGESPDAVSAADLADWQAAFGTLSALSTATTVPEPSAAMLLLTLPAWTLRRPTRRRPGAPGE